MPRVTGETPPHIQARVHLARAVALAPALLVLEHPGADLETKERAAFADCIAAVAGASTSATLVITKDDEFAKRVGAPGTRGWSRRPGR